MQKIKVYSTPSCPYCKMAKMFLQEREIPFEDIDVSVDEKAAEEMILKSGQMGVPVLEIGDMIIIGYNKDELTKALGLK